MYENVISAGATITAIAESLGHNGKFHTLEPHFLGGFLDIATLAHMSIIDTWGGTIKYPHHKQILFTFPTMACTVIANKKTWNCDRVVIRERVFPPEREEQDEAEDEEEEFSKGDEEDEGYEGDVGDEKGKDTLSFDGPSSVPPPPPFTQSQLSTHFDMGGSFSPPQMPYDATFSNLLQVSKWMLLAYGRDTL